jgi:hypothetical protein
MLSLASSSVPSVEFVGSLDILESPEISSVVVELHGFGVTSAESLSNKSVMESLSVSESLVTNSHTEGETHDESRGNSHVVSVEVKLTGSSESGVVAVRNGSTDGTEGKSGGSSDNSEHVVGIKEFHMEVVGRVLNGLNSLDLINHLIISLFEISFVVVNFRSVATHFYLFINNYNKNTTAQNN